MNKKSIDVPSSPKQDGDVMNAVESFRMVELKRSLSA